MYTVSDAFKTAISKPDRVLRSRITLDSLVFEDNVITSVIYNSAIVTDTDFEIGTAVMSTLDIEFTDRDYSIINQFENKEFKAEIGIKLADDTYEYIPLGLFTADKVSRNDRKINISSSDRMHKLEQDYVSSLVYPASLLQIAQDICTVAGVQLVNTSFPNSGYIVSSKPVLDNVSCRKAIAQIAELAGAYARITREGKLEIFNISVSSKTTQNYVSSDGFVYSDGLSINNELVVGNIEVNRDNYITLTNKDLIKASIDKVIVKLGSEVASQGDGENPYYIVDNIFCQNPNSVIAALYSVLNGLSYMPFNSKWQGNPSIDPGDLITINTGNGFYNTMPTSKKLTYRGGLREEYIAVGKSNTEKNSTPKGSLTIGMEDAKVQIKILKDGIEQTVLKGDFETYVGQTAEELTQRVSRGDDLKTEVTQNAEAWKLSIDGKLKGTTYEFTGDSFKIGDTTNGDTSEHAPGYSKYIHTDGTYTLIDDTGVHRFDSTGRDLNYRIIYVDSSIAANAGRYDYLSGDLPEFIETKIAESKCNPSVNILGVKPINGYDFVSEYRIYPNVDIDTHLFYLDIVGKSARYNNGSFETIDDIYIVFDVNFYI